MTQRAKLLQIGIFVGLSLVLLAALILLFDSLPRWFRAGKIYTIRFDEAPGIAAGTPVRRYGIRIGEVRQVAVDEERGIVRVLISVEPQVILRRNEQPTLTTSLIGSATVIDFVPQQGVEGLPPDRTPLEAGAEIVGVRSATLNNLLGQASEVVPSTQDTLNEMRKSLQRLERLSPLTEQTLREYRDLARDTRATIPELRRTNDEIQELARQARGMIPELRRTNDDLAATARTYNKLGERLDVWVQTNQDSLTRAVNQLNTVLTQVSSVLNETNRRNLAAILQNGSQASQRLDPTLRDADEAFKEAQRSLQHLDRTMTEADKVLGDLQKTTAPFSARSESISRNADQSLAKLNSAMTDLNALMRAIDTRDGTIQRLLMDPSLYLNINQVACQLARSIPRVDRILKDMETFADKLARHPESIGLGGVVRPDKGLKDPPRPYNPPVDYPSPMPGPPPGVPIGGPPPVLHPGG